MRHPQTGLVTMVRAWTRKLRYGSDAPVAWFTYSRGGPQSFEDLADYVERFEAPKGTRDLPWVCRVHPRDGAYCLFAPAKPNLSFARRIVKNSGDQICAIHNARFENARSR